MVLIKKPIFVLFILFLVHSCGGGDDNPPVIDDPVGMTNDDPNGQDDDNSGDIVQTVTLNLEGITLNYDGLLLVSSDNESSLAENQDIEIPKEQLELGLPILFSKNDGLLFGYYPEESDSEITNDDILFFFFASFPSIELLEIEDQTIQSILSGNPLKSDIIDEMIISLNNGTDPFDNLQFIDLFVLVTTEIISDHKGNLSGKNIIEEFEISGEREGKISWPDDIPLFSTVSVEIVDTQTNEVISRDFLSPKDVNFIGKIFDFVFELPTFIGVVDAENPSYQMVDDGEYIVRIANGNPSTYPYSETTEKNIKLLFTQVVGLVISSEVFKGNTNNGCTSSIRELLVNNTFNLFKNVILDIDDKDETAFKNAITLFIGEVTKDLDAALFNCSLTNFYTILFKSAIKKLGLALDTANIIFGARDFLWSDIYQEQPFYFSNGILVGEITEEVGSPLDFYLSTGEEFSYDATYTEKYVTYQIDRDGLRPSKVIPVSEDIPASFIPFKYEIFEGDATSAEPISKKADFEGNISFDFTMGNENSIIFIDPEFQFPDVSTKTILANICGNEEVQAVLTILEGVNWCGHFDDGSIACSSGPWFISGTNRITEPGQYTTSNDYNYEFYMDENCNDIYVKGYGFNGFTITYKVLEINESTFKLQIIEYPAQGGEIHVGTLRTYHPK